MEMKPGDIVRALDDKDRELLQGVLNLEKRMLHYSEIKNNSREEKEIVKDIMVIVDKVVSDVN